MPTPATGIDNSSRRATADVKAYPDKYIVCRVYMHAWKPLGIYREKADDGSTILVDVAICTRCGGLRERGMDASGELIGNTYHQADGYSVAGGLGPRAKVRSEYVRRNPPKHRDAVVPLKYRETK